MNTVRRPLTEIPVPLASTGHTTPGWRSGMRGLVLALASLLATGAQATDASASPAPRIALHGFGTLGLARSSSDQADFIRDLSQPDGSHGNWTMNLDSLLGLQANLWVNEQIEGVIQGVGRHRYDGGFSPELTLAFAKYNHLPNISLRAGRLGTEFYMLADSRLVGYSALQARPPVDYYGTLPFYRIDGMDLQVTHPLGDGLLRGKLYSGVTDERLPSGDRFWDLGGSRIQGAHLDYLQDAWQWRLGYAQIRYNSNMPFEDLYALIAPYPDVLESLRAIGKVARFYSLGGVYDSGPWQVHLMLSHTRQESAAYENGRAGYLLAGHRMGEFTPYLGYSWWKSTPKTLGATLPPPFAALVASSIANAHSDQRTLTLGLRWDFQENLALKAQWDRVRGGADSVFPVRLERPGWTGNTDVFSLNLDFVF